MSESGTAMSSSGESLFEAFLNRHDDNAWGEIISRLLPSIHEVDRTATQIWFHFFPLSLLRALQQAEDPEQLARRLLLEGKYLLKDQIDSSHEFFYGDRYWPQVKAAVSELAASPGSPATLDLAAQITIVAAKGVKKRSTSLTNSVCRGKGIKRVMSWKVMPTPTGCP